MQEPGREVAQALIGGIEFDSTLLDLELKFPARDAQGSLAAAVQLGDCNNNSRNEEENQQGSELFGAGKSQRVHGRHKPVLCREQCEHRSQERRHDSAVPG